jgi:hypothetical protein
MLFYREENAGRCVLLWKMRFYLSEAEARQSLLLIAHNVIMLSKMKSKLEYIKCFGDNFIHLFKHFIRYCSFKLVMLILWIISKLLAKCVILGNSMKYMIRDFWIILGIWLKLDLTYY